MGGSVQPSSILFSSIIEGTTCADLEEVDPSVSRSTRLTSARSDSNQEASDQFLA
jgi:hypothetical protein